MYGDTEMSPTHSNIAEHPPGSPKTAQLRPTLPGSGSIPQPCRLRLGLEPACTSVALAGPLREDASPANAIIKARAMRGMRLPCASGSSRGPPKRPRPREKKSLPLPRILSLWGSGVPFPGAAAGAAGTTPPLRSVPQPEWPLTIFSEEPARDTVLLSPTSEGSVCDIQLVTMAMVLSTAPILSSGTDIAPLASCPAPAPQKAGVLSLLLGTQAVAHPPHRGGGQWRTAMAG